MNIDLRTCRAGDRLKLRDGRDAEYLCSDMPTGEYPHLVKRMCDGYSDTYTDCGAFTIYGETLWDVVEIVGRT